MKAFEFDHRLIDSYARFSRSFSTIRSDDLKSEIDRQYDAGRFWPDALLSLNPRYLQGATVDDLVASGDLDEATGHIFRFGATPIRFHRHQAQSIAKARTGQSYVVTTGTGSGKSLCFFVPIVDAIVRARKAGRPPKSSSQQPHSFRLVTPRNLGRPGRRCRQPVKNCGGLTKSASAWRRRYRLRSTS